MFMKSTYWLPWIRIVARLIIGLTTEVKSSKFFDVKNNRLVVENLCHAYKSGRRKLDRFGERTICWKLGLSVSDVQAGDCQSFAHKLFVAGMNSRFGVVSIDTYWHEHILKVFVSIKLKPVLILSYTIPSFKIKMLVWITSLNSLIN